MQADIEIQSAAMLPSFHVRAVAGTGARSSLDRAESGISGAEAEVDMEVKGWMA